MLNVTVPDAEVVAERLGSDSHVTYACRQLHIPSGGATQWTHASIGLLADELVGERGAGRELELEGPRGVARGRERDLCTASVRSADDRAKCSAYRRGRVPGTELVEAAYEEDILRRESSACRCRQEDT